MPNSSTKESGSPQGFLSCFGFKLNKFKLVPFLFFPLVWPLHSVLRCILTRVWVEKRLRFQPTIILFPVMVAAKIWLLVLVTGTLSQVCGYCCPTWSWLHSLCSSLMWHLSLLILMPSHAAQRELAIFQCCTGNTGDSGVSGFLWVSLPLGIPWSYLCYLFPGLRELPSHGRLDGSTVMDPFLCIHSSPDCSSISAADTCGGEVGPRGRATVFCFISGTLSPPPYLGKFCGYG